ncbi:MAG: PAS domain S-box protein [Opitutae bacterium]|nr:PAS domain S-box protein [Opitutae bacterium]
MRKRSTLLSPKIRARTHMGALLLGVLLVGALFAAWSIRREDRQMREELLLQTRLLAQTLPLDRLKTLRGNLSDEQRPEYRRLKEQLQAAAQINPAWKWVYLMGIRKNGAVYFQMDSEAYDAPDPSPPGQIYDEASPILRAVFDSRISATEGPIPDRWGVWVSAFVPLVDPKTDQLITVVGIDIEAGRWRALAVRAGLAPGLFTATLIVILSLAYLLRGRQEKAGGKIQRRWRHLEASLVTASGLTLTLATVWLARLVEIRYQKEAFISIAQIRTGRILDAFLTLRNSELEGLARFIEGSELVTAHEFRNYARHLIRVPEVLAWAWVPLVESGEIDAFEQAVRDAGWQGEPYRIWETDAAGAPIPATARSVHYPIYYVSTSESLAPYGINPGRDLGAIGPIRTTLESALQTGLISSTDVLPSLPGSSLHRTQILVFRPIHQMGNRKAFSGFAMAAVDPEIFLKAFLGENLEENRFVSLDLLHLRADAPPEPVASISTPGIPRDSPFPLAGPWTFTRPILAFGRTYAVAIRPSAEFLAHFSFHLAWIALLAGLAITFASALVIAFIAHRREDMERLVDERTFDLASSMRRYDLLARHSRTITWETDAAGRYTDVSSVAEEVLGYSPRDLIGKMHFYDLHPEEGRAAFKQAAFVAFARRQPLLDFVNPVLAASGEIVWVSTNGMPILNPDGSLRGYQGTDKDITERKRAESALAALARQNQEAAERYKTLISASNTGAWEYHDDTAYMWASPEYFAMLGRQASDFGLAAGEPNIEQIWLDLIHPDDKGRCQGNFIDYMKQPEGIYQHAFRMRHADGHWVWILSRGRVLRDEDGRPTPVVVGTHIDISESKRAEEYRETGVKILQLLNEPEDLNDLLQRLVAMLKESTGFDAVGIRLQMGDDFPYAVQQGFSCDFVAEENDLAARDAQGQVRLRCACGLVLSGNTDPADPLFTAGGSCWTNDARQWLDLPPAGREPDPAPPNRCARDGYASLALLPIRAQNRIVGLLQFNDRRQDRFSLETIQILEGIAAHVGEALQRKRAEQDYRTLFHEMLEGFAVHEIICDAQGRPADYRFLAVNPTFERITGLKAADIIGQTARDVLPQLEPYWIETYGKVALTGEPAFFQNYSAALGKHFEVTAFRPAPKQFACIFSDVTERKRAEDGLRESRRQYAALVAHLPGMAYRCRNDQSWTMEFVSEGCRELTGYAPADLVENKTISFNELIRPAHRERLWRKWQQVLADHGKFEDEYELTARDGAVKWVWEQGEGVYAEDGRLLALEGFIADITQRKRAETERERLTRAIEQSGETIVITDADGTILYVNPAFTRTSGYSREEALGQNPRILQSGVQDRAFYRQMWKTLGAGETWEGQIVNRRKDGRLYTEQASISPVREAGGRIVHFVAVKRDISQQLLDLEEKEQLQTQLVQAQKMESIGRLAGGVAHDFNNMLQAILGYAEMALEQVAPGQPLHSDLAEIQKAARRSSLLTRQLQVFARKQAVVLQVLDLNAAVESMSGMLRRLIGEEIELAWKPGPHLGLVKMDPIQLDQIVANLCINARDAVGKSGRIAIETANARIDHPTHSVHGDIEAGAYVLLSVADDGCGMAPDVLDHIFEPFFTTKQTGKGTGLGLATVYGIVKQNHGGIRVRSEPGRGSVFQIFLPRCDGEESPPPQRLDEDEAPASRGGETILLVEDENAILQAARRMLESLHYRVLATSSPDEALRLAEKHKDRIQLLLTDVIMPGMNGPELVRQLLARQPKLAYLYMSGYTANLIAEQGVREDSVNFIQKPFSRIGLAQKVRAVLDGT